MNNEVRRFEDMSPDGYLKLYRQEDSDIVVAVKGEDSGRSVSVEFCISGGRSPKTFKALIALFKAMEEDGNE